MLASPWIAGLLALFLWWFCTGAILVVVKQSDRNGTGAHLRSIFFFLPVLLAGIAGFWVSRDMSTVGGSYLAFVSALAIWGFIELTFLAGKVTGPNLSDCPAGRPEWERFIRAWGTIAYHDIFLLSALCLMFASVQTSENIFGAWTFAILFFARISAQLNLFFGVQKINTEFLPKPLAHLPSHFRIARINWFFPLSITAMTFAVACWLERLVSVSEASTTVGFALLFAITALAMLEHWLMILPLPDEKLWRWMLPAPETKTTPARQGQTL